MGAEDFVREIAPPASDNLNERIARNGELEIRRSRLPESSGRTYFCEVHK